MTQFYSPSAKTFFVSGIHSEIPSDAVEISSADHLALLGALNGGRAIEMVNGSPIAVDRPVVLADVKASRIARLTAACAAAITGGFVSSALGTPHTYPSNQTDQINLLGSVADAKSGQPSDWTTPFWCADADGEWAMRPHSASEIIQVGRDGKAHVLACQAALIELSGKVEAATSVEAVAAIGWPKV